jgi:tetratricopeptide (TPR) repeat protein
MTSSKQYPWQDYLAAGDLALNIGEIAMAELNFRELLERAERMPPNEGGELRAVALWGLSRVEERLGKTNEALETCTQALAHISDLKQPEHILGIHDQMANLLIGLGQYQRAIPFCEEAVRLAAERGKPLVVADKLWRAGRCYVKNGLAGNAVTPLRKALDIFREHPGDPRTPLALIDLGNALRRDHASDAEACYKEAAGIWEGAGRLESATTAWVNLGMICSQQNRHAEALANYEKALRVREESPSTPPSRMGTLLNNIANCYRRMGQFENAKRNIDRAIQFVQPDGGGTLALAYGSRALIFRDEGAFETAAEWFTKARQEHEKQPSPNLADLQEVLENEADALARIGKAAEAVQTRERLAAIRSAISEPSGLERDLQNLSLRAARPEPAEGAVLIQLDGRTLPDEVYQQYDLGTLEDQLAEIVETQGVGEYDGNEFGPETTTLFLYGHDAEALFKAIERAVRAYPLCQNARVTIRQGPPGTPERELILKVDT